MGEKRNVKKVEKNGKKWTCPFAFFCTYFAFSICFFDFFFVLFCLFFCFFPKINAKKANRKSKINEKKCKWTSTLFPHVFPFVSPFSPFWLSFFPLFFPFYFAFVFSDFADLLFAFSIFLAFVSVFSSLSILRISYSLVNIILVLPSCSTPALRNRGGWPNHAASVCTGSTSVCIQEWRHMTHIKTQTDPYVSHCFIVSYIVFVFCHLESAETDD